ncbi:N-acetyltransferase [Streptomyces glebosus]|uniref:N-acetyltransferase n=1 Tax=Streptomyces glebosus TaxID=249580 RepID=A0A640T8I8_9ACTN|nr:GNAT family N-acetyltransferase [Streptomyces glebosus]GFE19504.1 N-acetyltransferase [Streptomyces glebosus]GHG63279.1 N-acetyltransferase [Streptomyces glebosus]
MEHPAEVLRSDQVELRRWRGQDLEILHQLITESRDHLLPWMHFAARHDREQDEAFLARCEEEWASGQAYHYAITTDGVAVGSISLMRRIGPGGLEIGYWLHHAWTGKGLMTMAAAALVQGGHRMDGIDRIEIHHDEANLASGAVARRLGFTEVERVQTPEGPAAPSGTGIDVIWRLETRPSQSA